MAFEAASESIVGGGSLSCSPHSPLLGRLQREGRTQELWSHVRPTEGQARASAARAALPPHVQTEAVIWAFCQTEDANYVVWPQRTMGWTYTPGSSGPACQNSLDDHQLPFHGPPSSHQRSQRAPHSRHLQLPRPTASHPSTPEPSWGFITGSPTPPPWSLRQTEDSLTGPPHPPPPG